MTSSKQSWFLGGVSLWQRIVLGAITFLCTLGLMFFFPIVPSALACENCSGCGGCEGCTGGYCEACSDCWECDQGERCRDCLSCDGCDGCIKTGSYFYCEECFGCDECDRCEEYNDEQVLKSSFPSSPHQSPFFKRFTYGLHLVIPTFYVD